MKEAPVGDVVLPFPTQAAAVWEACARLPDVWQGIKLSFTPDGKLVGDIGEAIAAQHFDLELCPKRKRGVDAHTRTVPAKTVQIKTTARPKRGPAFSTPPCADYLLFLVIDPERKLVTVAYNGPEKAFHDLWSDQKKGTQTFSLQEVKKRNGQINASQRLVSIEQ